MILFSSWLLQIDGRFNPDISSVAKDTVGMAGQVLSEKKK